MRTYSINFQFRNIKKLVKVRNKFSVNKTKEQVKVNGVIMHKSYRMAKKRFGIHRNMLHCILCDKSLDTKLKPNTTWVNNR